MKKLVLSMLLSSTAAFASTETLSVNKRAFAGNDRDARKAVLKLRDAAVKDLVADCESDKGTAEVVLGRVQLLQLNRARVMAMASAKVTCTK